jgi:phosphoribosylglycinamide formyltransferase-1
MRILGKTLLGAFPDRLVNIHPSLLPAFPGLEAQRQALEYGVQVAGCTVHFVNEGVDTGPIVMQAMVPVERGDTVDSLSLRILNQEHELYARALNLLLSGRWRREGRRVVGLDEEEPA